MPVSIRVPLGERGYTIWLDRSYRRLPMVLKHGGLPPTGWIVSHPSLLRRFGADLTSVLRRAGWQLKTIEVPESERAKSLMVAERVIRRLARQATMRAPVLLALGGGVVGDLTGFVAAVFRRGIPYVHLPTTLLAQVDSAIGGKVGVDLPMAKNLVGAFYQPRAVFANLAVLTTLPIRQQRSGLSEVVKYGMIADPILFRLLEDQPEACLRADPRLMEVLVQRCCRIKARLVARDERDTRGLRMRLNFGHTVGHALEAATRYRRFTHGEAIAIGMAYASRLSVELGLLRASHHDRLLALLGRLGLPVRTQAVAVAEIRRTVRYDKKFTRGRMRWVLPTAIGRVIVTERVPERLVWRTMRAVARP